MNQNSTTNAEINPLLAWAWKHGILVASHIDSDAQLAIKICKGLLHQVKMKFPGDTVIDLGMVTSSIRAPRFDRVERHVQAIEVPDGFAVTVSKGQLVATITAVCTLPGAECTDTLMHLLQWLRRLPSLSGRHRRSPVSNRAPSIFKRYTIGAFRTPASAKMWSSNYQCFCDFFVIMRQILRRLQRSCRRLTQRNVSVGSLG